MGKRLNLSNIVVQLRKYGLPVQFLEYVNSRMTTDLGDSDEVSGFPGFESLKLSPGTINPLKKASPSLPFGENTAIQTLYHEATHAYFLLRKKDPSVKALMESGKRYYDGAPLKRGETADDPQRLFHEAAASYVGHRAASWWSTLETIVTHIEMIEGHAKEKTRGRLGWAEDKMLYAIDHLLKKARNIPKEYNEEMKRRTFGYEHEWKGLSRIQTETTKRMSNELKNFCDMIILENKIPDDFNRAGILAKRHNDLLKLVEPLTHRPTRVRGGGHIRRPIR